MDTLLHDYAAKCYAFSTGLVSFQMLHASLQGQIMQTIMKYMTTQLQPHLNSVSNALFVGCV